MLGPVIWLALVGAAALQRDFSGDVYYVPKLLDKFLAFSREQGTKAEERYDLERDRLEAALAVDSNSSALTETVKQSELSRLEERNVLNEVGNFVRSVKGMMGSVQKKPTSCIEVTCGKEASCEVQRDGATCVCDEGFVGDGFMCKQPSVFIAKALLAKAPTGQAADLNMVSLRDLILLVYRDIADDKGYLLVGHAAAASTSWSDPVAFSTGPAFSPQVAILPGDRFVVSFRDANTQAAGLMAGGELLPGQHGGFEVKLWAPTSFARQQSHQSTVVPLPGGHFALLYSDKSDGQSFGMALLGHATESGIESMGTFPFAESAVTRLTSMLLSSDTFVVAYRAPPDLAADPLTTVREEAACIVGKFTSTDLVFDPHPLALEPTKTEIWDRGLGLLTSNKFMYTYQSGTDEKTMLAVVGVDKTSHRTTLLSKKEVASGFTPFARAVGLAYAPGAPRTFAYFESGGLGKYASCSLTPTGSLTDCSENTWLSVPLTSVTAVAMGDARVLFAFTGKDNIPYYQVAALNAV